MAPKRDDDDQDIQRAKGAREVREHYEEKPRIFDGSNILFRGAQVLAALGFVYAFSGAVQNYNYRLSQQDARIRRLERQVLYTAEFRAWHKVFQLKNAGKVDAPDPADFTTDRTE